VAPLYLETARESYARAGFRTESWIFPAGEGAKTLDTVEKMACEADARGLTRGDLFVALGGGVTGDLVGLAAALYLRGADFVQIPTTLLAMVDASVGGKTAANLPSGKNLVGAFHQPRLVICDPDTLETLPPAVYAEGMAEIIKHGAICDAGLLDRIRRGEEIEKIVADNIRIKAEVVSRDEKEKGPRQLLNLGHTFGHALEKLSGFTIYHGEGVSVGLCVAALAAEKKGLCPAGVYAELRELLAGAGLPVTTEFTAVQIAENAMNDKKRKGDTLTVVLPTGRGRSELFPIPAAELAGLIACCDGEVTGR
jgi:3-dehydroquinate synthase